MKTKIHERDVLSAVKEILEINGWIVYRINNSGQWNAARKAYIFHGTKGVPDIIALKKGQSDNDSKVVFVECKGSGGKLSPEQKEFLDAVQYAKCYSACVYGKDGEFQKFQDWLGEVKDE